MDESFDPGAFEAAAPAKLLKTDGMPPPPTSGAALCLSGGGYRATLFHLGAVWALKHANQLTRFDRIASASGGSILAGLLALRWREITDPPRGEDDAFRREIVAPIFALTSRTIDIPAAIMRVCRLHRWYDPITATLDKLLYHKATLQDICDKPRFVITATNVQSGSLWRFMKPRMRDRRVGDVENPRTSLSHAVAASAAYPPFLSPFTLKLDPSEFTPGSGDDLANARFRRRVLLTDAGVYDNLAIETAWKKYDTLVVSDAGWPLPATPNPSPYWLGHTQRAISIMTAQIAQIRQAQVKASFKAKRMREDDPLGRDGAYWGITSSFEAYDRKKYFQSSEERVLAIRRYPTRLKRVRHADKELLVDLGYFLAKLALEKYMHISFPENPPFHNLS